MIDILLLNFLLAVNLILRKFVLDCVEPIFFQSARLILGGILLLGFLYYFQRDKLRFKKADIGLFFQASLFFSYITYVFAVISLDALSSARYAFMFNLTPFITAIIAYFYWGVLLNAKEILSLLIGFLGFLPLIFVSTDKVTAHNAGFFSIPGLQLFIATIAYAYGWIIVKQLVKVRGYSPFLVTGIAFLSGGIATMLTSFAVEWGNDIPTISNFSSFFIYLIATVCISELIISNLYAWLLKKYSATFIAFSGFLYPIFSALLGWIFLKETVSYNFFISTVIVTSALYLFHLSEIDKMKTNPQGNE